MPTKKQDPDLEKALIKVAKLLNTEPLAVLRLLEQGTFPPPEHRLISIRQISVWLGVAERTIYEWIKDKKFPEPIVMGQSEHHLATRRWYFQEVHDWLHGRPRGVRDTNPRSKK